jgi:hypothetical protein
MDGAGLYTHDETEAEDEMLLEPPDPVDLLIASTAEDAKASQRPRPLDFVRGKIHELKKENKHLRERVADLEQTLSIVQTAQEWTLGKGMSPEQAEKMREIRTLLEQAKKAREDIQHFSAASRQALNEKLRNAKADLKKEKEEKREMKGRLLNALEFTKSIKEQNRTLNELRQRENEQWQEHIRDMKDRHKRKLARLQGDPGVQEADRHDQLKDFGEQVMGDLSALQQHLTEIRKETIDNVVMEGDEYYEDNLAGASADEGGDPDADIPPAMPPAEKGATDPRMAGGGGATAAQDGFYDTADYD